MPIDSTSVAPRSPVVSYRLGVGPEAVVGLCIERSLAMLVGLVGIAQGGAAYLRSRRIPWHDQPLKHAVDPCAVRCARNG
jgi:non-ribosomal peptide synthetase component F